MIIANTIKGKGVSFMENKCEWHGKAPKKEEYEMAIRELEQASTIKCMLKGVCYEGYKRQLW